jgi:ABC-2 type transport system permease protein
MRNLFRDLSSSIRNPEFWGLSGWLDIVVRYRQSRLGIFWLMAPAIIYVWGMGSFFASMQQESIAAFAAHMAIGYTVFRLVSSVVIESTSAFTSSGPFILDGHVRLTDFVLRVIAKALFYFVASVPVIVIALAWYPGMKWDGLALALFSFPFVLLNVLWIGVLFAVIGARFQDLSQFIGNIFMFAFLLTPIVWKASSMPLGSIRGIVARFNPLYHMVEIVRAPILGEPLEPLSLYYLLVMAVAGWALAALVYRRYARFVPIWI